MSGYNCPQVFFRAVDEAGNPAPGAKLYAFLAGTTIPKAIFYDFALTQPCPHPLIADTSGNFDQFFLEEGGYKFSLFDVDGNQLRPPEEPIYGAGGVNASYISALIGNSSEIVWNLDEDEIHLFGSLVWPLTPPVGDYINAPGSLYKTATGGPGYGSDSLTATASDGSDTRHGIELAHSGAAGTARVGNLDGTRLEYAQNIGGTGVHARGVGLHSFDGLISGELADESAIPGRTAIVGPSGRIGATPLVNISDSLRRVAIGNETGGILLAIQTNGIANADLMFRNGTSARIGWRWSPSGDYMSAEIRNDDSSARNNPIKIPRSLSLPIEIGGSAGQPSRIKGPIQDTLGAQILSNLGSYTGPSMQATNLAGGGAGLYLPIARDNSGNVVPRTAAQFRGDIGTSYLYDYTQKYNSADQGGGTTEFTLRNITIPASALAGTSGVKVEIIVYMGTSAMDAYLRFYVGGVNIISSSASRITDGYVKVILTMCANNARTGIQSIAEYYNVAAGLFYMNDPSDATVSLASDISASIRGYTMSPTGNIWLKSVRITSV